MATPSQPLPDGSPLETLTRAMFVTEERLGNYESCRNNREETFLERQNRLRYLSDLIPFCQDFVDWHKDEYKWNASIVMTLRSNIIHAALAALGAKLDAQQRRAVQLEEDRKLAKSALTEELRRAQPRPQSENSADDSLFKIPSGCSDQLLEDWEAEVEEFEDLIKAEQQKNQRPDFTRTFGSGIQGTQTMFAQLRALKNRRLDIERGPLIDTASATKGVEDLDAEIHEIIQVLRSRGYHVDEGALAANRMKLHPHTGSSPDGHSYDPPIEGEEEGVGAGHLNEQEVPWSKKRANIEAWGKATEKYRQEFQFTALLECPASDRCPFAKAGYNHIWDEVEENPGMGQGGVTAPEDRPEDTNISDNIRRASIRDQTTQTEEQAPVKKGPARSKGKGKGKDKIQKPPTVAARRNPPRAARHKAI